MPSLLRLLVVEDSAIDARHAIRWLEAAGYTCVWHRVEALDAFEAALTMEAWDVVVCDHRLPSTTGIDVLRRLRQTDAELPFILLSGALDGETVIEALRLGATDIALKDEVAELGPMVARALAQRRELKERRRVELALQMSEARLSGVVASAMDAIISIDEDGRILVFNAAAERMFAVSAATAIGQTIDQFVPERYRGRHHEQVQGFAHAGTTSRRMGSLGRVSARRSDGHEFPVEASISQVSVGAERILTVVMRDVSERVRADEALERSREELRALSLRLQSLREEERARLAREVHDQLGQSLTAIKLEVGRLRTAGTAPGIAPAELHAGTQRLLDLTDATIATVRRIASELRPAVLDHLGLPAAVEWLLREFEARTGVAGAFVDDLGYELDDERATALFRILQEGLTNVARHARASSVTVTLHGASGAAVTLELVDDGVGTPAQPSRGPSLGLVGMRERAAALGGTFAVEAATGGGTRLQVTLPGAPAAR